jgi:predicted RNA methylase
MFRGIYDMVREVQFKNYKLKYNGPHDIAAVIEFYVMDMYHRRNIEKCDTVIDISAGIGEFSVLASKIVGGHCKVISIESSPEDFQTLMVNMKTNMCLNVTPLNLAISDKPEKLKLEFKVKTVESNADSYHQASESLKNSASWHSRFMADMLLN